jgi:hypothetical protein
MKKTAVDMYDIKNIKDLPKELRDCFPKSAAKSPSDKVLGLFKGKESLHYLQVSALLYRKYGTVLVPLKVYSKLHYLSKKNVLERCGQGMFKLTKIKTATTPKADQEEKAITLKKRGRPRKH